MADEFNGFFVTASTAALLGADPSFTPAPSDLKKAKHACTPATADALLGSIVSRWSVPGPTSQSALLTEAWPMLLNLPGCRLFAHLLGAPPTVKSREEVVGWLVAINAPLITWDLLKPMCEFTGARMAVDLPAVMRAFKANLQAAVASGGDELADVRARFWGGVSASQPSDDVVDPGPSERQVDSLSRGNRPRDTLADLADQVRVLRQKIDNSAQGVGSSFDESATELPANAGSGGGREGQPTAIARQPTAIARHLTKLRTLLVQKDYVKVLQYSSTHREAIGLLNTKTSSRRLTVHNGALKTAEDDGDDIDVASTWPLYRSGYLFMVRAMLEIPSRIGQVGDRLAFLEFLEDHTSLVFSHNRILFADQIMFHNSGSDDLLGAAERNISLLWKYGQAGGAKPKPAPAPRLGKSPATSGRSSLPSVKNPMGFCRSRISKSIAACSFTPCKFKHTCPFCPGNVDHLASACPSGLASE
jgi:hypothetical protein